MSEVHVNKIQPEGESLLLLTQQVDALYDEIKRRAFLAFENRGCQHGFDREDWLAAESSLIYAPPTELTEEENQFGIRMAVPGFDPGNIRVSVLPQTIIVEGESTQSGQQQEGSVLFSEFSDRRLLRRIELPQEVRSYTARAAMKDGILQITVRKAAHAGERAMPYIAVGAG